MKLDLVKACAQDVIRKGKDLGILTAADEENTLRYACGCVPFKLSKQGLTLKQKL